MPNLEVPTFPDQLALLEGFFGKEIHDLKSTTPWRSRGLLMGGVCWGEKYMDRLENLCLPSIMGPANYETLKGRCRLVLYTDMKSYARLDTMTEGLENVGIDVHLRLIPDELLKIHNTGDPFIKYWILGVAQNACIQMAKRAGMAFHQFHPDHIHEETYFPNLFRLSDSHEAIAQTSISASVTAIPELEQFIAENGALVISGRDLGDIGYRHLHKQTRASLMNTAKLPDDLPESHLWTWQGRDKLNISCCHMNMAYLSPNLVQQATPRIPATIDAELPHFIKKTPFHVPTAEDGMTFIEVSDETKADNPRRVNSIDFAKHCWLKTRFSMDWWPYVERMCEIPIKPQAKFAHEAKIRKEHKLLMKMLMDIRGPDTIATQFIERLGFQ